MGSTDSLTQNQIILFDGVCNLCNSSVQFIIKRDKKLKFRFAALQSDVGENLITKFEISSEGMESIILISESTAFQKSNAALEIAKQLSGLWPVFYIFKIIPVPIRNAIYDWVARNRYRFFGRRDECMIPTIELKSRFL